MENVAISRRNQTYKKGNKENAQPVSHNRALHTEHAVRHHTIVSQAPKPPAALPSSKAAPGMYKGKVIQSKIGSIWKSSATVCRAEPKPSAPKTEGKVTKRRSLSESDIRGKQRAAPTNSRSVLDRATVPGRRPAAACSAHPPTRTNTATLHTNTHTKGRGNHNALPKAPGTEKKVNKSAVSSSLSQYRFTMETAEQRRAKLASWQAAKGKTVKRPAMTAAKPKVSSNPGAHLKPQSQSLVELRPAAQCNPQPEASVEAYRPHCASTQPAHSQTPVIMNTTLDLLETSEADLPVYPEGSVDDIVVNLCDALEALATPSTCDHECSQVTDVCKDERENAECEEKPEDVSQKLTEEEVKHEGESETEDGEVESDEDVMESTPRMEGASVVKYSVKTTPYLQSVKRTIEEEASTNSCRRKSNIKDLKFLTPVRRSCRIQRKSSVLPSMLVDHDPCVSSLAELLTLDQEAHAYIYRKNPALLEDLPDQHTA